LQGFADVQAFPLFTRLTDDGMQTALFAANPI
jgi:hypothetical protein